jgi:hypothetical protein
MAQILRRGGVLALVLAVGAGIGFTVFGILAYRAVTVERADAPEALRRFAAIRATVGGAAPLLTLDGAGRVVRRQEPPASGRARPTRLGVLAYRAQDQRLGTADMPFWFFKLKGPAAQFAVRGTGLDFERLQITAADLERYGPAVVIDHTGAGGDRLLVWTE